MDELEQLVLLILAVSLAAERLVEIYKGYFKPGLSVEVPDDPKAEAKRRANIATVSIIAGILSALLVGWAQQELPARIGFYTAIGIASSGGSAFWNSVVGYLSQLKSVKKMEAQEKRRALPAPLKPV
jgi:hypothetical protein